MIETLNKKTNICDKYYIYNIIKIKYIEGYRKNKTSGSK